MYHDFDCRRDIDSIGSQRLARIYHVHQARHLPLRVVIHN